VNALQTRGMIAPDRSGPYRFQVVLNTLYCDQYIGRKAEVKFDLTVLDRTGRTLYQDSIVRNDYEFTFFDNGIFSSIDTLGKHVERLLDKAVDEAPDKAALRSALNMPPRLAGLPST